MKSAHATLNKLYQPELEKLCDTLDSIIIGKSDAIRQVVTCLIADGHLLLEDVPGVGKTTLARAIAKAAGLDFQRVQFTNDLLPADVIGMSIFDRDSGAFNFLPGPIFTQLLLADEINRATPKSQSALLQAMEEKAVSVDGVTHTLPRPFFVIGTQNPLTQTGTFPLPESQLDRFLMRLSLGYPDAQAERSILTSTNPADRIDHIEPAITADQLREIQQCAMSLHVSDAAVDYLQALLLATRQSEHFSHGLSPRAGRGLLQAARARALVKGREFVLADDIQAVFKPVAAHRLKSVSPGAIDDALDELLKNTAVVPSST